MNDLTTELRRMADEAQLARPQAVAEILQDGDRMRRRTVARRSAAGLSAVAAIAVAAVAVTTMQPGVREAHQPSAQGTPRGTAQPQQRVQLTDWTVVKQDNGNISLTVRQFADTARLQQTLRADGVPASVLAQGQANPCHVYGPSDMQSVVTGHTSSTAEGSASAGVIVTIHPSALPSGDGLQFQPSSDFGKPGTTATLAFRLVQASPACTGS